VRRRQLRGRRPALRLFVLRLDAGVLGHDVHQRPRLSFDPRVRPTGTLLTDGQLASSRSTAEPVAHGRPNPTGGDPTGGDPTRGDVVDRWTVGS
jgi:hypothetical protein